MKQKGEELLVMNKKIFFAILLGIALIGIAIGYTLGYITAPIKEVYIQKTEDSEKTVLSTPVGTAFANKNETSQPKTEDNVEKPPQKDEKNIPTPKIEVAEKQQQEKKSENMETKKQIQALEQREKHEVLKKSFTTAKSKTIKKSTYTIQVGAFSEMTNVYNLKERLKKAGYDSFLVKEDLYKVRIGKYERFSMAKKISQELHAKGFENFIIKSSTKGGKS